MYSNRQILSNGRSRKCHCTGGSSRTVVSRCAPSLTGVDTRTRTKMGTACTVENRCAMEKAQSIVLKNRSVRTVDLKNAEMDTFIVLRVLVQTETAVYFVTKNFALAESVFTVLKVEWR